VRRFRILFALVSVAVLVPMALLVQRAVDSAALERRMRHQTVAERLFDEMERALSDVLTREEERPIDQYRFASAGPDHAGPPVRSPLADAPEWPFVVGYFQIDPDGSLHTPHRPRPGDPTAAAHDWNPSPEMRAAIAEIERTVGPAWAAGTRIQERVAAPAEQLPGSTLELPAGPAEAAKREAAPPRVAKRAAPSVYDALRALNTGVEQREARQAKDAGGQQGRGFFGSAPPGTRRNEATDAVAAADRRGTRGIAEEAQPVPAGDVELAPMVGRRLDDHRLILYRTVLDDGQGYRQGLLVDIDKLGAWLRERALGASGLHAFARVDFAPPSAPPPSDGEAFAYTHRFAEPFDGLSARLSLKPLPGVGDTTFLYAMAALLVVATLLGLAALYRMVTVVLRYVEQRSNFVAAVTHELKTPLTAIRMYGEMLRDGIVPTAAKRDEYYRHITAESERLTRLVNNVLELARLEKRARPEGLETMALEPLLAEVATLLRPHVEGAGLTLRVEVGADLPPVRCERDALVQVLFNLVDNAVKYASGSAPPEVVLSGRRDGGTVRVAVRDHGPGVSARHLRRVFDPFYRVDSELTRRSKGTGIGLALVRSLAERMGARVTAANAPDGGFVVELAWRAAS